jgi:hypothetical protein
MKSINVNAPVTHSETITINAKPVTVWRLLTNINEWPRWQKDISYAKIDGEIQENISFTWKTGGAKITSVIHTAEATKCLGWTGTTFGATAIHNWTLTEKNNATEVLVEESMQGFLVVLLKKMFRKNLAQGMKNWLEVLKYECEVQNA